MNEQPISPEEVASFLATLAKLDLDTTLLTKVYSQARHHLSARNQLIMAFGHIASDSLLEESEYDLVFQWIRKESKFNLEEVVDFLRGSDWIDPNDWLEPIDIQYVSIDVLDNHYIIKVDKTAYLRNVAAMNTWYM